MKKRILASILAVASLGACFAGFGCGGEKKDPNALQISVVNVGYGAKWAHELAKAYMKLHPEVKIQVDDSYTGGLDKGLSTSFCLTLRKRIFISRGVLCFNIRKAARRRRGNITIALWKI